MPSTHETHALGPSGETTWRISPTEIAALARVERAVPANWRRRHGDFPEPIARDGGRTFFDGREIVDWLLTTGHGNADENDLGTELALHSLSAWTSRIPGRQLLDVLTALMCLRHHEGVPLLSGEDTTWESIVERAGMLDEDDTCLISELTNAGPWGPPLSRLADELVAAAGNTRRRHGGMLAVRHGPAADAFEWLLGVRHRLGFHDLTADTLTPGMTECIARLTGIDGTTDPVVANPGARGGDLLVALHSAAGPGITPRFVASDTNRSLVRLVRRRMLVRGVLEQALDVQEGESVPDAVDGPNVVASVLPYLAREERLPEATLERIEALTDLLADRCTAVVLGPADALTEPLRPHDWADRFRRDFLTNGLLKAVVALPGGVMPYRPGYRTALWVLARTPEQERRGRVLLADLSGQEMTERTLTGITEDIRRWRAGGWDDDVPSALQHGVVVPVERLNSRAGAALTPPTRATTGAPDRVLRMADLELRLKELGERAHRESGAGGELTAHASLRTESSTPPSTTIARLRKERRLRMLPGHRIAAEYLLDRGDHNVLTPAEVLGRKPVGTHRIDRALLMTAYRHVAFTEPGDLVITAQPEFGAYIDADGFSVVAYPARVLRIRSKAARPVRPRVLAAFLSMAAAEYRRTRGSVHSARTLEELEFPDVGPVVAERLDALLEEIERRSSVLRQQIGALDELGSLATAGMADGTLTLHADQ
ncbi:DNA methyltransferase family protein [Streptomyces hirsutus]|uniref:hypothetical protein n=1 Tax=Streptomyces hirsutus TaxID=35620 RepID=UPI00331DA6B2